MQMKDCTYYQRWYDVTIISSSLLIFAKILPWYIAHFLHLDKKWFFDGGTSCEHFVKLLFLQNQCCQVLWTVLRINSKSNMFLIVKQDSKSNYKKFCKREKYGSSCPKGFWAITRVIVVTLMISWSLVFVMLLLNPIFQEKQFSCFWDFMMGT